VNAVGNSDWSNTANDTTFGPNAIAGLEIWLQDDLDVYQDTGGATPSGVGDAVARWDDQSDNAYSFQQSTGSKQPVRRADGIEFDGTDDILVHAADVLASIKGTIVAVYEISASPSSNQTLISSSDEAGDVNYFIVNGYRSSSDPHVALDVREGASFTDIIFGADEIVPLAVQLTTIRSSQIANDIRQHKTSQTLEIDTGANNGNWLGDTTGKDNVTIGAAKRSSEALFLKGKIRALLVYDSYLSGSNLSNAEGYLIDKYGLFEATYEFGSEVVVTTSAGEPDHNAWPGIEVASNGDLVIAYSNEGNHTSSDGDLIVRISDDGGDTWGSEDVIWDYSVDGGGTTTWMTSVLTKLANDDILIAVSRRVSGVPDIIGYFTSDDDGATWSGPTTVTQSFSEGTSAGGGILQLANGDLLYPFSGGKDAGDLAAVNRSIAVSRSQDGGSSWSQLAIILDGGVDGEEYSEPGLVLLGNGDIVCLYRYSTASAIMYGISTSDDSGATWSAHAHLSESVSGLPTPMLLSTGEIISIGRDRGDAGELRARVLVSEDSGVSWRQGKRFIHSPNSSASTQMVYGQAKQGAGGTIYAVYGDEWGAGLDTADIMFVKTI
jgi:hypothetical protein